MEPEFEKGEALMALSIEQNNYLPTQVKNMNSEIFFKESQTMKKRLIQQPETTIFELNWQTQFLSHAHKLQKLTSALTHQIKTHLKLIAKMVLPIAEKMNENTETNYLAVAYECLSEMETVFIDDHNVGGNLSALLGTLLSALLGTLLSALLSEKMRIFVLLDSRKRSEYGLYYFKGMTDARLDITSHVLRFHF